MSLLPSNLINTHSKHSKRGRKKRCGRLMLTRILIYEGEARNSMINFKVFFREENVFVSGSSGI
jgi:hypothetical protein